MARRIREANKCLPINVRSCRNCSVASATRARVRINERKKTRLIVTRTNYWRSLTLPRLTVTRDSFWEKKNRQTNKAKRNATFVFASGVRQRPARSLRALDTFLRMKNSNRVNFIPKRRWWRHAPSGDRWEKLRQPRNE